LGTNVGQRETNLAQAVRRLAESVRLLRSSSIYETAPWGYTDQPHFLNCVLEAETNLMPLPLLAAAKRLEEEIGREPTFRWGPRLVDVDILLYGDVTIDLPDLQIPHSRMAQRAFVLVPLAELVPGLLHPTLKQTIGELVGQVEGKEGVRVWGPPLDLSANQDVLHPHLRRQ
jgi:2-amino-4-hydroxy-6-hydroxymethyldihydropteridine diphosphokinase